MTKVFRSVKVVLLQPTKPARKTFIMSHCTKQSVLFPELLSRPALIVFDQLQIKSDGGALLLKAVDDNLGLPAGWSLKTVFKARGLGGSNPDYS